MAVPHSRQCQGTLCATGWQRFETKHSPSYPMRLQPAIPRPDHRTKMKPLTFDGRTFRTQKAAIAYLQGILNRAPLGEMLDGETSRTLYSLVKGHPDYEAKAGVGIQGFEVHKENEWGTTRHFVIVRKDGSRTDFSYRKCLAPTTRLMLFKQACRHTIAEQIVHFRDQELARLNGADFVCPVLGLPVSPNLLHVDHEPPWTFDWLVTKFLATAHIDVDNVTLTGFGDNELRKGFADSSLREGWLLFHKTHARPRLVSKQANLSEIRKQSRKMDD